MHLLKTSQQKQKSARTRRRFGGSNLPRQRRQRPRDTHHHYGAQQVGRLEVDPTMSEKNNPFMSARNQSGSSYCHTMNLLLKSRRIPMRAKLDSLNFFAALCLVMKKSIRASAWWGWQWVSSKLEQDGPQSAQMSPEQEDAALRSTITSKNSSQPASCVCQITVCNPIVSMGWSCHVILLFYSKICQT